MQTPVILFPISIEELQHLIKTSVEEAVRVAAAPSSSGQVWPEVLTKKEAMKLLGDISVPTFDSLVRAGKITQYKPSQGCVVFLRSEIMGYIVETKVVVNVK